MLVTTKELFEQADKNNYAIPAANFFDLDSARTYVKTAERLKETIDLSVCPVTYGDDVVRRSRFDW